MAAGRRRANGQHLALTAAHRTRRFGSHVTVTNKAMADRCGQDHRSRRSKIPTGENEAKLSDNPFVPTEPMM
jgi:hypothetical protein